MVAASAHGLVKLAEVMGQHLPADSAVAVHAGQPMTWAQFQADVGALSVQLERFEGQRKAVLYSTDAYPFAVGLMALWRHGFTVCLPGHPGGVPASQTMLWVGEGGPEGSLPIQIGAPVGGTAPVSAAPMADPALIVFTSGSNDAPKAVHKKVSQIGRAHV